MENFFMEVVSYMRPPSSDVSLVTFGDTCIRETRSDVHKHLELCSAYAKQHEVYLITGLFVHEENLCLCLISPQGELVCRQAANQLHISIANNLKTEHIQHVVQTPFGNITLCVDADIYYPQVLRTAALKGADIVISIQHFDSSEDTPARLMTSVWNAAQTNNLYVVNISGSGCTVTCPSLLTRNQDGYIIHRTTMIPTRFGFNMRKLDEVRMALPLLENLNTNLVQNYTEELGRW